MTPSISGYCFLVHPGRPGHDARLAAAIPDTLNVPQMVETARTLNPAIEVAVRTHSEDEAALLAKETFGKMFFGEEELAKGMMRHILTRFAPSEDRTPDYIGGHNG